MRTPDERALLDEKGASICLLELQGALFFGSTERLLRRVDALAQDAEVLILDFRRVHDADQAARRLIAELDDWMKSRGRRLLFANLPTEGPLAPLQELLATRAARPIETIFPHRDGALEFCENRLIAGSARAARSDEILAGRARSSSAGLTREELKLLEAARPPAGLRGRRHDRPRGRCRPPLLHRRARHRDRPAPGPVRPPASVPCGSPRSVPASPSARWRSSTGRPRSADVVADERVVCYGFSVEALRELGRAHPNLIATILGNMMRDLSERLRRANDEIRALEQ